MLFGLVNMRRMLGKDAHEARFGAIKPGDVVLLYWQAEDLAGKRQLESFWVDVSEVDGDQLMGVVDNIDLVCAPWRCGSCIHFKRNRIGDLIAHPA